MSALPASPLVPALLALGSALLFAVGIQLTRIGLRHTDTGSAALIQIGSATAVYWLAAPLFVEAHYWRSPAVILFAVIGLFRRALSAFLAVEGTQRLGPTISSTAASTAPLFAVAAGVMLLDENLSAAVVAGTAGIIAGVAVLSWRGGAQPDWTWWALLFPVGAAALRSLAHMLAKIGLEILPSPFFVGLVGYTVSSAIAWLNRRRRANVDRPIVTPGLKWLAWTGVIHALAILSLNTALQHGRLVMVAPIVACSPLFTLLLGWLVFREEALDRRTVLAVLLIVPGVVVITLAP